MPDELFFNYFDLQKRLESVMPNAPVEQNLEILFGAVTVSGLPFLELYRDCLAASETNPPGWKAIRRTERALALMRYFEHAHHIEGAWVECGIFKGFSALLLARLAQARDPDFTGAGFHLIDSFEGLSQPTMEDAMDVTPAEGGKMQKGLVYPKGHFATPVDHVRTVMSGFPDTAIHKGWIPEAFTQLPETSWAFVHLDVDLYEPTLAGLQYFYPRLSDGGIIINDDYISPMLPGAGRAWDQYCDENGLAFAALDSGQAILIKPGSNG